MKTTTEGQAKVIALMMIERSCWAAACEHDGINPRAKAAVFSDNNPFIPAHLRANKVLRVEIERRRQGR